MINNTLKIGKTTWNLLKMADNMAFITPPSKSINY